MLVIGKIRLSRTSMNGLMLRCSPFAIAMVGALAAFKTGRSSPGGAPGIYLSMEFLIGRNFIQRACYRWAFMRMRIARSEEMGLNLEELIDEEK